MNSDMPKIDFWSIKKTKWKTFISFTARLVNKWSWVSTMTYLGSKLGHSSGEIGKIRPFLTLDSLCKYENQTWALIKETWCKKDRFTIFPIFPIFKDSESRWCYSAVFLDWRQFKRQIQEWFVWNYKCQNLY